MLQQFLEKQYGIKPDEELSIGKYTACKRSGELYLIIPAGSIEQEELSELEKIALHLYNCGERHVSVFLQSKEGGISSKWQEDVFCVLINRGLKPVRRSRFGRKLAKFHYRGRSVNISIRKVSRIGQWKQLWEKRLDQMENVWNGKLFQQPENDFEKMFLESFPYYMGLAENAIQYLADTELDGEPKEADGGTVCHERFSSKIWGDFYTIKNPFDWVFDHCSRDLAEWTRERYFHNIKTYQPELKQFFLDYQTVSPLSPFAWRLLYSRILFPLHYFECIEGYYITKSEQQKNLLQDQLVKILQQSQDYERFLAGFYHLSEVPVRKYKIPEIDWLKRF